MPLQIFNFHSFSAWGIKCRQCNPDLNNIANVNANSGSLTFCSKPTESIDCSRDPNIGSLADSCYTADVTISVNTTLPGVPLTDIRMFVLNCSVMSLCSFLKDQTCGGLETAFEGMPQIQVKNCDVKCCQGDLCNDPSNPPSDKSSVKMPQTTTLCGLLVLIALTFMNF